MNDMKKSYGRFYLKVSKTLIFPPKMLSLRLPRNISGDFIKITSGDFVKPGQAPPKNRICSPGPNLILFLPSQRCMILLFYNRPDYNKYIGLRWRRYYRMILSFAHLK